MSEIKYFVFFDLETTGLPWEENNGTKITELSMVAVSRCNLLNNNGKGLPRVVHKLSLCFNPTRMIHWRASDKTDLWNISLENERPFDKQTTESINLFLEKLEAPVCLVAHNGYNFDYSVFNTHVLKSTGKLSEDLLCVDSLPMFKDILANDVESRTPEYNHSFHNFMNSDIKGSEHNTTNGYTTNQHNTMICNTPAKNINFENLVKILCNSSIMISPANTPVKRKSEDFPSTDTSPSPGSAKRKTYEKSPKNYQLGNIYEHLIGRPAVDTHRAECDCMILLECCTARAKEFIDWCDDKSVLLKDIKCMEVGKEFPNYVPKKPTARKRLYLD